MAKDRYKKFFYNKGFTYAEMRIRIRELQTQYENVTVKIGANECDAFIVLKPTAESREYLIKVQCKKGATSPKIYVLDPLIERTLNEKSVPHMYSDTSLCLYHPPDGDYSHSDSWAETLIPWTSLWLFYFEIWAETGKWLGGGIHPNQGTRSQ